MKRVFLFGRIDGAPDLNYEKFNQAEAKFKDLGYHVINPHKIKENMSNIQENMLILNEISQLLSCDTVALLDDWYNAKKMHVLIHVAQAIELNIIHADTLEKFEYDLTLSAVLRKQET